MLIDEAYHPLRRGSDYATSVPYVLEGRPVIVDAHVLEDRRARRHAARLRASRRRSSSSGCGRSARGTINAIVKWGGVAALNDTESQAQVKKVTIDLRKKTTSELAGARLRVDSVGDELLHGAPAAPGACR